MLGSCTFRCCCALAPAPLSAELVLGLLDPTLRLAAARDGAGGGRTKYARPCRPVKPLLMMHDVGKTSARHWLHRRYDVSRPGPPRRRYLAGAGPRRAVVPESVDASKPADESADVALDSGEAVLSLLLCDSVVVVVVVVVDEFVSPRRGRRKGTGAER